MEDKYYIPRLSEFYVGFEYECAETYLDGTVKSQEDFDNAKWGKAIMMEGDLPYISRTLYGKNAENRRCGIRVKYLDKEDFHLLGYNDIEELDWRHPRGPAVIFKKTKDSGHERMGHTDWIEIYAKFFINSAPRIKITIGRSGHESGVERFEHIAFCGSLKNKSEFQKLIKQIGGI